MEPMENIKTNNLNTKQNKLLETSLIKLRVEMKKWKKKPITKMSKLTNHKKQRTIKTIQKPRFKGYFRDWWDFLLPKIIHSSIRFFNCLTNHCKKKVQEGRLSVK